jgi:ethanolamine utilization protein EutN
LFRPRAWGRAGTSSDIFRDKAMVLGKVVGTIWATRKDEELTGLKLLVVKHLDLQYALQETFLIAVDTVQAGVGDVVLVCTGSAARHTAMTKDKPVDAVITAVVDSLDTGT